MLRLLIVLVLISSPALAWEIVPSRVCELRHEEDSGRIRITYDPAIAEYAISINRDQAWSDGEVFSIRFAGQRDLTISTSRHVISDGGATLTVTDKGFDNVLNGIEFNHTATAMLSDQAIIFSLVGAGPAVRAFKACTSGLGV